MKEKRIPPKINCLAIFLSPIISGLLLFIVMSLAFASSDPSSVDVTLTTTTNLFMDSRDWCNPNDGGPDGAWYSVRIVNNADENLNNLRLQIELPSLLTTGDADRRLGAMDPGDTVDVFFYVNYSQLRSQTPCSNGDPPVTYNKTFTLTLSSPKLTSAKIVTGSFTSVGMLGASVGGTSVSSELGPGSYVGQLITMTVDYAYGNNAANTPLFLQPSGNASFRDDCFRLIGSRVLASNVDGINPGDTNKLWFSQTNTGNNDFVKMEYTFHIGCAKTGTSAAPWSEITSGGKYKYNDSTYAGGNVITITPSTPITQIINIEKSVSPELLIGAGVVTYTVRFQNLVTVPILIDSVNDTLPSGMAFQGVTNDSEINPINSSEYPEVPSSGSIYWHGYPQITYQVPPSGTASIGVPGSLELIYTSTVPASVGLYTNWVTATIGNETTSPVSSTVSVESPTAVFLASFTARPLLEAVQVDWETILEIDSLGFNLYRSSDPRSGFVLLNSELIPVKNPGSLLGSRYIWLDSTVLPRGDYYYLLEEVDIYGKTESYGPIWVTFATTTSHGFQIFLPLVNR
jgi:uncharacterized repeat protein (TIGR01451 family)